MNTFYKLTLTIMLVTAVYQTPAAAIELTEIYYGARPFGMGNAYTAIANDEYSIFTNPAGIARARKNRSRASMHMFKFPNITVGSNGDQQALVDLQNGQKTTQELIAEGAADGGKPLWLYGGIYPVGVFEVGSHAAAVGGYVSSRNFIFIDSDTPDNAQVESVNDAGAVLNFAYANRTNRFNIGLTIRPMQRYAYEDTIPTIELEDQTAIQARVAADSLTMTGMGVDAGMMFTFADFWFPTLGVAVLNLPTGCEENFLNPYTKKEETICGTIFQPSVPLAGADATKLSTIEPTDVRVGFSITPRITRKVALRLALDFHHINVPAGEQNFGYSGIETLKTIHAGVELFAGNPLERNSWAVRVGANQGNYTMGATIKFSLFAFEFATFGQDISTTSTRNEDRRFLGNFSIEF